MLLSRVIDIKCDGKICRDGSRCKRGNCICPKNCDDSIYEPVCGSDGHTVSTFTKSRKTIHIYFKIGVYRCGNSMMFTFLFSISTNV